MRSVHIWALVLGLVVLVSAGMFFRLDHSRPAPQQAVYVWQRNWTPAVEKAVLQSAGSVDTVMVLAGEFEAKDASLEPRIVHAGWNVLAKAKKPVWAVIRAHQLPGIGDAAKRGVLANAVSTAMRDAIESGRSAGARMRGAQLDYDCPTERLGEYAEFLHELRGRLPETPLAITALPDWLSRPAFHDVLTGLDHFVLQVHSLDKPSTVDSPVTLCDPARTRQWIHAAGKLGCPFYVALPTYGYRLYFDARGDFAALGAEDAPQSLASDSSHELQADPEALAALVREAGPHLPPNALGWAWFRLPVAGDTRNWTWPVLRGVMAGQAPQTELQAEMRTPSEGLHEIWVRNTGVYRPAKPIRMAVHWGGARLGAYDVINGFRTSESNEAGSMHLEGSAPAPGAEAMVAWYRTLPGDSAKSMFESGNVEVMK